MGASAEKLIDSLFTPSWAMRAVYFAVGIVLVYEPWWMAAPGLLGASSLIWWRFPLLRKEVLIALLLVATGLVYMHWHQLPAAPDVDDSAEVISATVTSYPRVQEKRSSFTVKTASDNPYFKRFQVFCDFEVQLKPGDRVELKGVLKKPDEPGNPGEFNYPSYLSRHHIYYLLQVEEAHELRQVTGRSRILAVAPLLRSRMVEHTRAVLPAEEAALILAMVLGIQDNLDEDLYQDFQKTGLVHLFAVSGLNVGFVILLASGFIALGRLSRVTGLVITIFLVLLYSSLTGWPVSIQRAVAMALLSLLAGYAGRHHEPANGLGLAALIILIVDPCALFTISFQLSFLATWGLVSLYPAVKKYFKLKQPRWDYLLVPLCAQVAVLPLIAYYFHLITPVSILSNLLATYLAGIIVILGFVALLLAIPFPLLSTVLLMPTGVGAYMLLSLNSFCKALPLAYWIVATPEITVVVIYFVGLLWLTWQLRLQAGGMKLRWPLLMMGVALVIILIPRCCFSTGQLQMSFIDVGQGDSILLKTPHNRFILIDGGGSLFTEVGRRKVLPYLNHLGVNRLYMVINTHPDVDHIQGLLEVMPERPAKYVGLAAASMTEPLSQQLLAAARQQGSRVVALEQGQVLNIDGVQMEVWYPPQKLSEEWDNNERSLLLYFRYRDFSALLTADQSKAGLEEVLRQHQDKAVIVKVPHHGSRYAWSSELDRNAQWLVLSVGKNAFGHPHQEVVEDIARGGARLLRTDRDGLITFSSDGRMLRVETFKSGS